MPTSQSRPASGLFGSRLTAWLILAAATAIFVIVLPLALQRSIARDAQEAEQLLARTLQVSASASELRYYARDMEVAAIALANNLNPSLFQERYASSGRRARETIQQLKDLLAHSPDQLLRLGNADALLNRRMPMFEQAIELGGAGEHAEALALAGEAIERYPVSPLVLEILATEDAQLETRQHVADTAQNRNRRSLLFVALAQCALLGTVMVLVERQFRQRLRAETRSQTEQSRTRAIFQSVREPIALVDGNLHLLMCNNAFSEAYGVETTPVPSPRLEDVGARAWKNAPLLQRLRDVAEQDRELWDLELGQSDLSGNPRTVLVNARRIALPDRDPAVLITLSDVTARKLAELRATELNRELEEKVDQVTEANRELEAFSYSVSHDLRAPLRHIAGFSEKLQQRLDESSVQDEKAQHYLGVIQTSAQRLAVLIDDLLAYSRLGRHALRLQAVRMDVLVAEVRTLFDGEPGAPRIDWVIGPMPTVICDESMLRQVWQNLIGNAVKYSRNATPPRVEIDVRRDNGTWTFRVADNGAGFDMRYAGKLFGVFQRLHKASEFPGSGIGLAIVKRIVNRHGGDVSAESEPGQGATFRFTLPAAPAASPEDVTA